MKSEQIDYQPEYIALEKKLKSGQKECYDLAKEQGYLKQKGGKESKAQTAFYYWCESFGYPCVVIEERGLTSVIKLSFPLGFKKLSVSTVEQLWEIVIRYADPFETNTLFYIRHVPSDEAENVASEILEIIEESSDEAVSNSSESLEKKLESMLVEKIKPRNRMGTSRSQEIVASVRRRANGVCELCNKRAPFKDRFGNPYLEVHHIKWISRGGEDSIQNTAAICPNCHKKMRVLDLPDDRVYLSQKAKRPFVES